MEVGQTLQPFAAAMGLFGTSRLHIGVMVIYFIPHASIPKSLWYSQLQILIIFFRKPNKSREPNCQSGDLVIYKSPLITLWFDEVRDHKLATSPLLSSHCWGVSVYLQD